ncbi:MAG: nucleotidyltransferase domain-containing protein [Candidatus Omnitrophica bacterium]|nr:nucleotidyltransferase domain-containing protein [Candidatus Omnitrophota bacterium]
MKIRDKLDEILNQGSKIKILRFLFAAKDEHTGRGIAKAINMSVSSTYETLQEMKDIGIVSARRKGKAKLYKLRENNHFVKELLAPLFEKEKALYNNIINSIKKALLKNKKNIISIAIFGSVASNQETSKSDIDLAVIVRNNRERTKTDELIDKLSIDMAQKFGVAISPYVLTVLEFRHKYSKKLPIIKSIVSNNKLIYGEPIERIIA